MKALNYLNSRDSVHSLKEELLCLPKIYQIYITHFKLGDELEVFRSPKFLIDDEIVCLRWENSNLRNPWKIEGDRLLSMSSENELLNELNEFDNVLEPWHSNGMIKIGSTHGDLILLGTTESIRDQIFLYGESTTNETFINIAENIFEMFSKIILVEDSELMKDHDLDLNQLYKNWNEDFWRVRKDNT